jgi:hypothetical protein
MDLVVSTQPTYLVDIQEGLLDPLCQQPLPLHSAALVEQARQAHRLVPAWVRKRHLVSDHQNTFGLCFPFNAFF